MSPLPAILGGPPAFADPILVTKSRKPPEGSFERGIADVLASRWFTNKGAKAVELERDLEKALGVDYLTLACNGTVALLLALRALDVRGSVVTTPFTFPATAHAIVWSGLTPVFADIDPETYGLDPEAAEAACLPDTSVMLPVHVYGIPCDVEGIARVATKKGLRVLYDAAHTFMVKHAGRPIESYGDLSVLSFHATKLFHTCEGGAVVARDAELDGRLDRLRNFGILDEERVEGIGLNAKMSEVHAAMGLALLAGTRDEIGARSALTARYVEGLAGLPGVRLPRPSAETTPNFAYLPIEVDADEFGLSRDELHLALRADGILARKYFYPLCTENPAYRDLPSAAPARLPVATRVARRMMTLPLYGDLPLRDVDRIVERVRDIHGQRDRVRTTIGKGRR